MTRLSRDGFVLTQQTSGSFAYGYAVIFSKHLPVYVSADSILEAVHRSYDALLQTVESRYLAGSGHAAASAALATERTLAAL